MSKTVRGSQELFPDCTAVKSNYYPGNKNIAGYIQKIINEIPPADTFLEMFAGSGTVSNILFVRSGKIKHFHLNDISLSITERFNYPSGSTVTNKSFSDLIQSLLSFPAGKDIFLFCDPPYLHETRPSSTDIYEYEMSDHDHVEFLHLIRNIDNNCMITHPACDLYDRTLYGWRTKDVKVRYHNKTSLERIYMNYDHPGELAIYDMVGTDCWDRQRIKRKINRRLESLKALPAAERNYFLDQVKSIYFSAGSTTDEINCTISDKQ